MQTQPIEKEWTVKVNSKGRVATRNSILATAVLGLIGTISGLPAWFPALAESLKAIFGL